MAKKGELTVEKKTATPKRKRKTVGEQLNEIVATLRDASTVTQQLVDGLSDQYRLSNRSRQILSTMMAEEGIVVTTSVEKKARSTVKKSGRDTAAKERMSESSKDASSKATKKVNKKADVAEKETSQTSTNQKSKSKAASQKKESNKSSKAVESKGDETAEKSTKSTKKENTKEKASMTATNSEKTKSAKKTATKKKTTKAGKGEESLDTVVLKLIAEGKQQGVLTYEQIMNALERFDLLTEQIEDIYGRFNDEKIEVVTVDDRDEDEEDDKDVDNEEVKAIDGLDQDSDGNDNIQLDDPVRMYLKEIGRVPLLNAQEEVDLAKRIEAGKEIEAIQSRMRELIDWLVALKGYAQGHDIALGAWYGPSGLKDDEVAQEMALQGLQTVGITIPADITITDIFKLEKDEEVMPINPLNKEEEQAVRDTLYALWWSEEEQKEADHILADAHYAKQDLTDANLRLVVSIAKRYVGRGMQFLDLMQEGNLGLIKAVEKFDYTKGYKFSTYATWWIRQAITRAIADQARTIRIPVHMVETINKLSRTSRNLLQELGRDPKPEEIAEAMEITVDRVREIQKISQEPVSLETPIGEEEDSHLVEFIEDRNAVAPEEAASATLLKEQVDDILKGLSDRERDVIYLRFGLKDGKQRTLEEVGQHFDVTRERIRQIERKALEKLRSKGKREKITDYL